MKLMLLSLLFLIFSQKIIFPSAQNSYFLIKNQNQNVLTELINILLVSVFCFALLKFKKAYNFVHKFIQKIRSFLAHNGIIGLIFIILAMYCFIQAFGFKSVIILVLTGLVIMSGATKNNSSNAKYLTFK